MSLDQALEALAVVLAVAYLILAVRESIWCWACALGSTAIYIYLFHSVALFSESLLNAYYLAMAVYGWYRWKSGGPPGEDLAISTRPWRWHVTGIVLTTGAAIALGSYMSTLGADFPYLDAATSCFAVWTTWMVANKVLENWFYWFAIDAVSAWLFWEKGLVQTALLFVLYLLIIVPGYVRWRRQYANQPAPA